MARDLPIWPDESIEQLLRQCRVADLPDARLAVAGSDAAALAERIGARRSGAGGEIIIVELPTPASASAGNRGHRSRPTGPARSIGEIRDGELDCVLWADDRSGLTIRDLQAVHPKLQMNGTLGLVRNQGAYDGSRTRTESGDGAMREWVEHIGPATRPTDPESWLAAFDQQVRGDPLAIATAAEPLFSLPLGRQGFEWRVDVPTAESWDWVRRNCAVSDTEETRAAWDKVARSVTDESKGTATIHGQTLAVWTTKIPA